MRILRRLWRSPLSSIFFVGYSLYFAHTDLGSNWAIVYGFIAGGITMSLWVDFLNWNERRIISRWNSKQ